MNQKVKMYCLSMFQLTPTGDLHIGHARNAAVGDALANILTAAGYNVTREYYINDAGNQITNLARSIETRFFEALGDNSYSMPEDGYNGKDIIEIGKDLAEKHPEIKDYSEEARLKEFRKLGVEYEMAKLKMIWQSSIRILIIGLVKHLYMKKAKFLKF